MAEDTATIPNTQKTRQAKRLDDAIKRGDMVRSTEVNTWFTIAGGVLVLMVFATPMAQTLELTFRGLLANSYQIRPMGPRSPVWS